MFQLLTGSRLIPTKTFPSFLQSHITREVKKVEGIFQIYYWRLDTEHCMMVRSNLNRIKHFPSLPCTGVFSSRVTYMKCTITNWLNWCHSPYISMDMANNTIHECIIVTSIGLCYQIMFAMRADHHGTNVRYQFHVCLIQLCL